MVIGRQPKIFLTGLTALLISALAAIVAGMYLGSVSDLLKIIPGLMVLLPPSINMRGSISGVLASRLSSSMHLGVFEVVFKKGSVLGDNLRASFVVTVIIAFVLGIFADIICTALGISGLSFIDFVLISVISGIVSGLIVMGITLLITLVSYRYGLDLDMIAAPTVTTTGDIVTIPTLVLSAVLVMQMADSLRILLGLALLLVCVGAIIKLRAASDLVKSISGELVPLLTPLCFVGTLAGLTYALDLDTFVAFAVFLILIPPFSGGCGSIAGILCSRLATGMHMGAIEPTLIPGREVISYFLVTYLYAIILLPLLAVAAHGAAILMGLSSPGLQIMIIICIVSGLFVITVVTMIAYATASVSFCYGLDPDNFGIPVITGVIDLIGATTLVAVINILV